MKKNKQLVPKRRFKEFENDGEWERRKFIDIVTRISSTSSNKDLPRIEYEDIISGKGKLNKDIYQKESTKNGIEFEEQDILFGKLRPYLKNWLFPEFKGVAVGDFWVFRATNTHPIFVYSLIQAERYQRVSNLSTGTKMPRADWNIVSDSNFFIPKSVKEQKQIGDFLNNIDELITVQQNKLSKTKLLKKSYLSDMFPKEGEKYPKKRFEGFTDSWEYCALGDVVQITMGQSPNSENYTENPDDYILVQGNSDMKKGKVVPRIWTTQITKEAEKGDLILSVRAPVGDIGKTNYDVVLGRGVAALKGNDFIYQTLARMKETGYWNNLITGSTFESINSNDIRDALIAIPSKEEQIKIGSFFKNLDAQIDLEKQKLEKLEQLKQAYLNELFV